MVGCGVLVVVEVAVVVVVVAVRGVRYIDEKLLKADKSVFLKLSATYRYRKLSISENASNLVR